MYYSCIIRGIGTPKMHELSNYPNNQIIHAIEGHKGKIYDFAAVGAELWCIIVRLHQSGAPEVW